MDKPPQPLQSPPSSPPQPPKDPILDLNTILPPRLEDAGLEDCALPPESIHEAFLKAASLLNSRFPSSDDESDPVSASDHLPRVSPRRGGSLKPCLTENAGERADRAKNDEGREEERERVGEVKDKTRQVGDHLF